MAPDLGQIAQIALRDLAGQCGLDSIPKLKGLAKYAATYGETFRRIDAVAKVGESFRVLDLKEEAVRAAVESATSVKALYESAVADDYTV